MMLGYKTSIVESLHDLLHDIPDRHHDNVIPHIIKQWHVVQIRVWHGAGFRNDTEYLEAFVLYLLRDKGLLFLRFNLVQDHENILDTKRFCHGRDFHADLDGLLSRLDDDEEQVKPL